MKYRAFTALGLKAVEYAFASRRLRGALLQTPWLSPRYTILCYHRVADDGKLQYHPALTIPTQRLHRQLLFLQAHYEIMTVGQLQRSLTGQKRFRRPPLAISFDDGDFSVWANVVPLLERQGVPATFFVNSGVLESGCPLWPDAIGQVVHHAPLAPLRAELEQNLQGDARRLVLHALEVKEAWRVVEALKPLEAPHVLALGQRLWERFSSSVPVAERPRYVSAEHISQLHRKDFEIGGHTLHHALLDRAVPELARQQIQEDKRRLEAIVGEPLVSFAYPNGNHNAAVRKLVMQAGYRCAVAVNVPAAMKRRVGPFALARCFIGPDTGLDERGAFSEELFFAELIGCLGVLRRAWPRA